MNIRSAEQYLEKLTHLTKRVYLCNPADCSWYLKRLQFLLDLLDNPEQQIPHYIHVTGTSGKGSVAIFLTRIFAAGNRGPVGLVTSPGATGLLDRVEVNGTIMTNREFVHYVTALKKIIPFYKKTSPYDIPSHFELLTAVSLMHLAVKKVHMAIIEVGLGGRYDSTNSIPHKDAAVITNIGRDHLDIIGPTLKHVAIEKSGIIKPGGITVTGEHNPKLLAIIKKESKLQKSPLTVVPFNYSVSKNNKNKFIQKFTYKNKNYTLNTLGEHQIKNALLAITTAKKLGISQKAIARGLAFTHLPIRLEVVSKKPLIIIDGAHNPDKMQNTVATISNIQYQVSNIHLVLAFSADKEITTMLKLLATLKPTTVACTRFTLNKKRAFITPKKLSKLCKKYFPKTIIKTFSNPAQAFDWSKTQTQKNELLLVTGSMYLAGELRPFITSDSQ